jgi:2-polyprenyl-3-methyl-5-hydroxy-6-metoxy-1,4-benzoquinol methylase
MPMVDNTQSRRFFEQLASEYDATRNAAFLRAAQLSLDWYLDRFAPGGGAILEIGVGTGEALRDLERRFTRVTGIDVAFNMANRARAKVGTRTQVAVASAEELSFPDKTFDCVLCMDVLEHVQRPVACLQEIARVLAPGGIALVTTPNPLWAPVHWVAEAAGLKVKEGPHKFVFLNPVGRALARTTPGIEVLHSGYLVYAPFPLLSSTPVGWHAARVPLLRRLGHNQLLVFRRTTS